MGAGQSLGPHPVRGSVVVGRDRDGAEVRRNPRYKNALVRTYFPEVHTMYDAFQRGLRLSRDGPCLGFRPMSASLSAGGTAVLEAGDYEWWTYAQVAARVDACGSGMLELGLAEPCAQEHGGHRFVGLFCKNRPEWSIVENACHAFSLVDVPLYDTLGDDALVFIFDQTQLNTVFTTAEGALKIALLKQASPAQCARLRVAVQFESGRAAATVAACAAAGLRLLTLAEVEAAGLAHPRAHTPPAADDLSYLCYTSGTTGMPKGVMMTHGAQVADAASAYTADLGLQQSDVHLSYLPLAHVFERLVHCAFYMAGASLGFYQGDTLKITEDIKALRPTVFCSVPRLYNRIYEKVMGGVEAAGGLKRLLFLTALESKRRHLVEENVLTHSLWDTLVFAPVAQRVGLDRVRVMLTGSAPIAPHVIEFLRVVFRARVCEGYGQTECAAAATLTSWADMATLNHVGGPLACNEVKLISVPEMGYLTSDVVHDRQLDAQTGAVLHAGVVCAGRGEVCYRGHNVFPGYFRDPERTAEALDAEGWLHSGDVGLWDSNGNLRIIDRKKNIFKLAQGEYVAAEKVEVVLGKSPFVSAIFVHGDSLHSMLVAVVVPSPEGLAQWAKSAGGGKERLTFAELCADPACKAALLASLEAVGRAGRLQGFELVRDALLEPVAWTPEDLLTPSFKLRRAEARKRYAAELSSMYDRLERVAGVAGLRQG